MKTIIEFGIQVASTKYVFSLDLDFISDLNTLTNREYNKDVTSDNNIINCSIDNIAEFIKEYKNETETPIGMVKLQSSHYSTSSNWVDKQTQNVKNHCTTQYQLCFGTYAVAHNDNSLQRYDKRFTEYRPNNITHIAGLDVADGYNFYVSNNKSVVSILHTKSKDDHGIKTDGNKNVMKRRQRRKHMEKMATVTFDAMRGKQVAQYKLLLKLVNGSKMQTSNEGCLYAHVCILNL